MGDDLVAHCDSLAKFGLVDYQMGVSEEEIIDSMLNANEGNEGYNWIC